MTDRSGFEFPGYMLMETQDTDTKLVETGVVRDGDYSFVLTMVRPTYVAPTTPFLVKEIGDLQGNQLWTFEETTKGPEEFCNMAKAGEHPVIAVVRRGPKGAVVRVIPLVNFVGVRFDVATMIGLKRTAAQFLGRDFELTKPEQTVGRILAERQRQAEEARQAEARKRADEEREARVRRILAREPVEIKGGRWGIPVLEAEWQSLPHGTFVVLVDSFNEATEGCGLVLETFRVVKERGRNPVKGNPVIVSTQAPAAKSVVQPEKVKPIGIALIEIEPSRFEEVPLYASQETLRRAREQGLNSGSYAGVLPNGTKKVTVVAVHHDKVDTIGEFFAEAVY